MIALRRAFLFGILAGLALQLSLAAGSRQLQQGTQARQFLRRLGGEVAVLITK